MDLKQLSLRLPRAELAFAHFNAHRTASEAGLIERGATATFEYLSDSARPESTYYNRAVGRSNEAFPVAALGELPAGIVALELTPEQSSQDASEELLRLGFRPVMQLCYLGTVPDRRRNASRRVERLDASQADFFLDLLEQQGVEFPPEKRAHKRGFYCTDRFRAYVARDASGTPCAWTTMFVENGVAFFGNSFTLPQWRRTGAHLSLLDARLDDAAELGLEVAYTDVEHRSQSFYNCVRAGFATLTINTIWRCAAAAQ
jgi:hypothetical protein